MTPGAKSESPRQQGVSAEGPLGIAAPSFDRIQSSLVILSSQQNSSDPGGRHDNADRPGRSGMSRKGQCDPARPKEPEPVFPQGLRHGQTLIRAPNSCKGGKSTLHQCQLLVRRN